MTDRARCVAALCLAKIWDPMDTDTAKQFPFTECHDLSLMYQWYSRDLHPDLSRFTPPMFILLLVSQNRRHLSTILQNDPNAVSHFSKCLQNLGKYCHIRRARTYIYPNLMDLLMSVNPKMPLFTVLYNSSVLVQLWKLLVVSKLDAKKFLLLVNSKLDREKLDELFAAMNRHSNILQTQQLRNGKGTKALDALERSTREFGQIIGVPHSGLESTTEQSAPKSATDKDHDIEERAQVPGPSEHKSFHSVANWTKTAFRPVWPKTSVK